MRSSRLSLRRHPSTAHVNSEPPTISKLLELYSKRSSEQSIRDVVLPLLMKFAGSEQALVMQLSRNKNPIKILTCIGFNERNSDRLLALHKGNQQASLQKWFQAIAEQLMINSTLFNKEPQSTVPDELSTVHTYFCRLFAEQTAFVIFNPDSLQKKAIGLLDDFCLVVEQLLREETQHSGALRSLDQLALALDRQGEGILYVSFRSLAVKHASESALQLLNEKKVVGRKLWHIFDKEKDSLKRQFESINNSQPDSPSWTTEGQEAKCWKEKGQDVEFLVNYPGKIMYNGSPCLILLIKRVDSYEKRARDAEAKAKNKTEFMAHLGHEIRTPLSCILSILPLIAVSGLNEEQKRYLKILQQSSMDMMSMVSDFLDMAKLDNKMMQLHESEISIQDLFQLLNSHTAPLAAEKNIELNFHVDHSVPNKVYVDFARLRQVIRNLVGNAIKFTPKGGSVRVLATAAPNHSNYHQISITVIDTGIGIAKENFDLIFKSFRQVDESTTQEAGGIGLGLAISKKLMKLMNHGSIEVKSKLAQGSEFIVKFNSPILDNELLLRTHQELFAKKRVLIVDDIANNRITMFGQFEKWGFEPTVSASAEDAIATCLSGKTAGEPFDLAILDLRMPNMNGVGLANWIRRKGYTFPFILLSSSSEDSDNLSAEDKALFKFCLLRPVPERRLLAHVASAMGSQEKTLGLIINTAPQQLLSNPIGRAGSVAAAEKKRMSRLIADVRATRILIAEDTSLNRQVMESLLRKLGYATFEFVNNGQQVLEMCEQPNTHFDLVLLDMRMPVKNGFDTSKELSNLYSLRRLPRPKIIATTAMAPNAQELIDWCAKGYLDDVIGKPIDIYLLKEKIDRLFSDTDQKRRISTPI